jgi:hypothetical protein
MIEMTFLEFHEQQYDAQPFCLYVVKNASKDVLYVGISENDIWERWFGWGGHMTWDSNVIYGESPVGLKIENHLPDSFQWEIQLWTLQDCLVFCRGELPSDTSELIVKDLEPIMIRKLSPALNGTYNQKPGNDATPKSKNEVEREKLLDQLYKEIFDKE